MISTFFIGKKRCEIFVSVLEQDGEIAAIDHVT